MRSSEMSMTLKPGSDGLKCPECGCGSSLPIEGGDTIPIRGEIPNCRVVAGGMALSNGEYCFSACLNLFVCGHCKADSYAVHLDRVRSAEVTEEWANKYFALNEKIDEPSLWYTVTARGRGIPKRWIMERVIIAPDGDIERLTFGLFALHAPLRGEYGVACCAGGKVWEDAAKLLGRVWPLTAIYWFDAVTFRGMLPLRPARGWELPTKERKKRKASSKHSLRRTK